MTHDRRSHKLRNLFLLGVLGAVGAVLVQSKPDIERYLKIRSM